MADPVTIGWIVASALAVAAPGAIKNLVGEAVRDAYTAFNAEAESAMLEKHPGLKGKLQSVAEIVAPRPTKHRVMRFSPEGRQGEALIMGRRARLAGPPLAEADTLPD